MKTQRILFFGTPSFAIPALGALVDAGHTVLVVTRPDKPAGRKKELTPTAVKEEALRRGLPLLQPAKLDADFLERVRDFHPDVAVLASYGKIIKPELLQLPAHGFVNIHPSLLPRHRGASPVAAAILAGDEETGVTIMRMDEGLDSGPLLATETLRLRGDETAGSLTATLATRGVTLLLETLDAYLAGRISIQHQDARGATYASKMDAKSSHINWQLSAQDIDRLVRANNPNPGAWTTTATDVRLKVLFGRVAPDHVKMTPGTLIQLEKALGVVCGHGTVLRLDSIQPAGKSALDAQAFANGYARLVGTRLI